MTLSVIEGHSSTASLFKCDISYLWCIVRSLRIHRASCFSNIKASDAASVRFGPSVRGPIHVYIFQKAHKKHRDKICGCIVVLRTV